MNKFTNGSQDWLLLGAHSHVESEGRAVSPSVSSVHMRLARQSVGLIRLGSNILYTLPIIYPFDSHTLRNNNCDIIISLQLASKYVLFGSHCAHLASCLYDSQFLIPFQNKQVKAMSCICSRVTAPARSATVSLLRTLGA